jgi:hypothetical protein
MSSPGECCVPGDDTLLCWWCGKFLAPEDAAEWDRLERWQWWKKRVRVTYFMCRNGCK